MGIFSDLLSQAKSFDAVAPSLGGDSRAVVAELEGLRDQLGGDVDYPAGFDAANEVQSIAFNANIDGGTFTLTFTLWDGTTFTTAGIAWNANAATIQSAIDTASPSGIANGDIVITGGNLATANVVLTFSGASVAGQNHSTVVVGNSLTDGGVAVATPAVTVTTNGQKTRPAWAVLRRLGVISGTPPVQGTSSVLAAGSTRATNPYYPDQNTIRALAREAGVADRSADVEASILRVAGLSLDGR